MKAFIKKSLAFAGLELKRVRTEKSAFDVQSALCKNPHPVIFDVGANIGQTIAVYRRLFPTSRIYAFEPFPDSFLALTRSFAHDKNTTLLDMALSDRSGDARLFSNTDSVTNSLLETIDGAERFWGDVVRTKNVVSVRVDTLSNFCRTHSIDYIDILKIDTQGTELAILRGADDLLGRKAIDLLYFEMILAPTYSHQTRIDECFSYLYKMGYRLKNIYNLWQQDNELLQCDVLFTGHQNLQLGNVLKGLCTRVRCV
jgi:FkbM family methyltransferase